MGTAQSLFRWETGFFPGSKAARNEVDHSLLSSAEFKSECDMTGDTAVLYSEILSLRLCKSAERVWDSLIFKRPHKMKSEAERSGERDGQEMSL